MDQANILIIGGGVIGCSIVRAVSQKWQDVFLLEQNPRVGMATSTRNSGVIHSGIYYPKDSLKAKLCVRGNDLSYEFCEKYKVPYRKTGKLVVAANKSEEPELEKLIQKGITNGVTGLKLVGPKEIHAREPHIQGTAAIDVPSTGILSAEELVRTHARLATDNGANIVTRAKVVALTPVKDAVRVDLEIGDEESKERESIEARDLEIVPQIAGRVQRPGQQAPPRGPGLLQAAHPGSHGRGDRLHEPQRAARSQDTLDLPQEVVDVGRVRQRADADDRLDALVGHRQQSHDPGRRGGSVALEGHGQPVALAQGSQALQEGATPRQQPRPVLLRVSEAVRGHHADARG